ncbi:MAG: VanZ family protein [Gammaproteobacteria bacterium]|jgi:VanZ family protein|nr:VanZ family protein [Gammaproteobacteria bacterium]MBK8133483.1 VanZ family protein [Gammaproteobacteria bacterium]MBK9426288.1 VanZ family protein [Gammaproteobacteria bacterium]
MTHDIRRWWRAVFWVTVVLVSWASLRPITAEEWFSGQDKVLHLLAYSGLYGLGRLAFSWHGWRLSSALLTYGVIIELLQSLTPHRFMSAADVVANAAGLAVGALVLARVQCRWPALWTAIAARGEPECR